MAKFNYIKWVTENKFGKQQLNEQTGSATGSIPNNPADPNTGSITYASGSATGSYTGSFTGSVNTGNPVPQQPFLTGSWSSGSAWQCPTGTDPSTGYTFTGNFYSNTGSMGACSPLNSFNLLNCCESDVNTQNTGSATGSAGCDTSPNSPCAQTWFGNNASKFANFMSKLSCDANPTYAKIFDRLMTKQIWGGANLWGQRPNQNVQWPPAGVQNFNDIRALTNDAGFTQPLKRKFKRKLAKSLYANCMAYNNIDGCCST